MRIVARYLLWILIAVLPMQGSAAAFMALAASPAAAAAMMQEGHCDKAMASSDHPRAPDGPGLHAGADLDPDGVPDNVHSQCSSCASCCIGACAPPLDYVNPVPHPQVKDGQVSPEPAMTAFISATLERPPRHCA